MPRSIAAYLADIVDACEHILEAAAPQTLEAYQASKTLRRAVERDFQIIGFRHILVHEYFNLDDRTVWDTIIYDVRPLRDLIAEMLTHADGGDPHESSETATDPPPID